MRPVNLIPPEDRRGDRAPLRTGILPYVVVGFLVAVLAGVAAVVVTNNQVSDREAEVASLEARQADAQARAEALQPYTDLATLSTERSSTVTSLAQSRFDWDRVLRELALVIPGDVWLTQLSGTVSPDVGLDSEATGTLRAEAAGPALSIVGCASGHASVAAFLQALRDIDGVTRVGITSDERATESSGSSSGSSTEDADCRTRNFISKFEILAAFDAVTVSAPAPDTGSSTPPATTTAADDGGVAEAQQQEQDVRDSTAEQRDKADKAVEIIPGVAK